jgi:hypothetical protein
LHLETVSQDDINGVVHKINRLLLGSADKFGKKLTIAFVQIMGTVRFILYLADNGTKLTTPSGSP